MASCISYMSVVKDSSDEDDEADGDVSTPEVSSEEEDKDWSPHASENEKYVGKMH
jgi:hypothetical protein